MTANSRTSATVALAAAVVVATVGAATAWWALIWCALVLAVAGGSLLLWRRVKARPNAEQPAETTESTETPEPNPGHHDIQEEPPTPRRTYLSKAPLPSAHPEYDVLLSAVVYWHADQGSAPGTDGRAKTLVLERAAKLTRRDPPEEFALTRQRIAADLGQPLQSDPRGLEVWADEVRLELRDEDAERLRRIRDFRKDEEIREYERAAERRVRDYLRSDMLANPGQAVLWWLARDPEHIHDTVSEIGTLSRLSAAANGTTIPRLYRDLARDEDEPEPFGPPRPAASETGTDLPLHGQRPLFVDHGPQHDTAGTEPVEGEAHGPRDAAAAHEEDQKRVVSRFVDLLTQPDGGHDREVVLDIVARLLGDAGHDALARFFTPYRGETGGGPGPSPASDGTWEAPPGDEPGGGGVHPPFFRGSGGPVPDGHSAGGTGGPGTVNAGVREGEDGWSGTTGTADPGGWFGVADWVADADGGVSRSASDGPDATTPPGGESEPDRNDGTTPGAGPDLD